MLATAWRLASRVRDVLVLVRGRPVTAVPTSGRELAGLARVLGHPAGAQADVVEDYRRATRRARSVVERLFYA